MVLRTRGKRKSRTRTVTTKTAAQIRSDRGERGTKATKIIGTSSSKPDGTITSGKIILKGGKPKTIILDTSKLPTQARKNVENIARREMLRRREKEKKISKIFFSKRDKDLSKFRQSISKEQSTFTPVIRNSKIIGFRDNLKNQSIGLTQKQVRDIDTERFAMGRLEAIKELENPIPALFPFDKEQFALGKYFIDVEYSGSEYTAEFNLVDSEIGRATSELQSPDQLVCRLLLEKKKQNKKKKKKKQQPHVTADRHTLT